MYHPTTRVLTILELLQAYPQISGAELATRLEVSQRSIRRYVTMLQDLGIPVEATRGPQGGYRLRPGFKLPPLMLTDDEALAIMLSLHAARRQWGTGAAVTVEGALAKIERVLPPSLRERLQDLQRAVMTAPAPQTPQPHGAILLTIGGAVAQGRGLHICYRANDGGETERAIDPYGLVRHWDRWYVVSWCALRQDLRVFRVDRVIAATLEDRTFARPPGWDSVGYVLDALALTPRRWSVDVLLETTLEDAQRHVLPGIAVLEPLTAGVVLRTQAECLDAVARMLITLGCPFVIRQPPELREAVRHLAAVAMTAATRTGREGP